MTGKEPEHHTKKYLFFIFLGALWYTKAYIFIINQV